MKTPWTSGPWRKHEASIESKDYIIAKIFGWSDAKKTSEGRANRDLIAIAPEMAEAIMEWSKSVLISHPEPYEKALKDLADRLREIGQS